MIGLTTELKSVEEGLISAHRWCIETYGKGPSAFILGPKEYFEYLRETRGNSPDRFLDIPIVVKTGSGIDVGLPRPLSYKNVVGF